MRLNFQQDNGPGWKQDRNRKVFGYRKLKYNGWFLYLFGVAKFINYKKSCTVFLEVHLPKDKFLKNISPKNVSQKTFSSKHEKLQKNNGKEFQKIFTYITLARSRIARITTGIDCFCSFFESFSFWNFDYVKLRNSSEAIKSRLFLWF